MYKTSEKIIEGTLNNTIPQLSTQDPEIWAVSISLLRSGRTIDFGPVEDVTFTIQSIV
jgi:glutaminase